MRSMGKLHVAAMIPGASSMIGKAQRTKCCFSRRLTRLTLTFEQLENQRHVLKGRQGHADVGLLDDRVSLLSVDIMNGRD